MSVLLDASAWVEYFNRSEKGKKVLEILELWNSYTSIVTIAEIVNWALRESKSPGLVIKSVEDLSKIIQIDKEIAKLAGNINFERKKSVKKWGMIDSLIFATAIVYDLKVVTKDSDFNGLLNVEHL